MARPTQTRSCERQSGSQGLTSKCNSFLFACVGNLISIRKWWRLGHPRILFLIYTWNEPVYPPSSKCGCFKQIKRTKQAWKIIHHLGYTWKFIYYWGWSLVRKWSAGQKKDDVIQSWVLKWEFGFQFGCGCTDKTSDEDFEVITSTVFSRVEIVATASCHRWAFHNEHYCKPSLHSHHKCS